MADQEPQALSATSNKAPIACGIVMPISSIGDCSEGHWTEVLSIISDAVENAGFEAKLVSTADEITIIQKTIVHNLYNSPIVICDVSEKNANVMFELGMRLAFDKPTIIIKDDRTTFSFDTGVIEHVEYPRDLRFSKIVEFKKKLAEKTKATYEKQAADPMFSTFLRHFGQFKVASIEEKEVSSQEFIIEQLSSLQKKVDSFSAPFAPSRRPVTYPAGNEIDICCGPLSETEVVALKNLILDEANISSVRSVPIDNHIHIYASADIDSVTERRDLEEKYQVLARSFRKRKRQGLVKQPD